MCTDSPCIMFVIVYISGYLLCITSCMLMDNYQIAWSLFINYQNLMRNVTRLNAWNHTSVNWQKLKVLHLQMGVKSIG